MINLIVIAFQIAKARFARGVVGSCEILAAYQSAEYSMSREEVEILHKQEITGKMIREDLWCPFSSTEVVSNVKPLSSAVTSFESRTEDALLTAAMLPCEAAASEALRPHKPSVPPTAKVLRFRKGKASKEDLLAGAAVLADIE